jgi:hypothetical protein
MLDVPQYKHKQIMYLYYTALPNVRHPFLTISCTILDTVFKRKQTADVVFPMDSEVDHLLAKTVESSKDKALQRYHLYGPVCVMTPTIFVYVGAYGG